MFEYIHATYKDDWFVGKLINPVKSKSEMFDKEIKIEILKCSWTSIDHESPITSLKYTTSLEEKNKTKFKLFKNKDELNKFLFIKNLSNK